MRGKEKSKAMVKGVQKASINQTGKDLVVRLRVAQR